MNLNPTHKAKRARRFFDFGRIRVRLLVVNLLVLLVPLAGLEFARIHERQLLESLQRDMTNQASLVRASVEHDLDHGIELDDDAHAEILTEAAKATRTRIRLLDTSGAVVVDSHANGPPEGPEPPPPSMLPRRLESDVRSLEPRYPWPKLQDRPEVKTALRGYASARTRVRERAPGVILFIAAPIRLDEQVVGAVYVVRSTQPVMVELYRIRSGLFRMAAVATVLTLLVTLALAWSISRPLELLSRAAKRIAGGQLNLPVPVGGAGEIRELGEAFAAMKERLDARLRYISEFSADVAHEFKSPLTSIGGAAELLDEGAADDPVARARFLRNIRLDVARLDRLVTRLLELSRIEASSAPWSLVDLKALVARVVERTATPDQPVVVNFGSAPEYVEAREADLESALANLVENAIRFSPANESVSVEVRDGGESLVCIAVRDRGPGVAKANQAKVFDRFFTTDADRDGTGLGLSIVKSVATAHGGEVALQSEPGEGATFTITLPLRQRVDGRSPAGSTNNATAKL